MKKTRVALLGSTGSIGENTFRVLSRFPDRFELVGAAAGRRVGRLAEQVAALGGRFAVTGDETCFDELRGLVPPGVAAGCGVDAMIELVTRPEVDAVLCAIVGTAGLRPVLAAIRAGKRIALASKEVMVMAGELVNRELAANPAARIVPVDSEHSAIFQCLEGRAPETVAELLVTASGGPFRNASPEEIAAATCEQALAHPVWNMGPKITIDSATLMNKALELIEARHLFRVEPERIKVVLHPQSIVHSMIRFVDGSVMAQLSRPDMRFAIQYALTWPERLAGDLPPLDFAAGLELTFGAPDRERFPSLDFAYEAMRRGGTMPAVLNAANEVAVEKFRRGEIRLPGIWRIVGAAMAHAAVRPQSDLETIVEADREARGFAAAQKG